MNHTIRQQRWISYSLALLLTLALSWGLAQPALAAPVDTDITIWNLFPGLPSPVTGLTVDFRVRQQGGSAPITGVVTVTHTGGRSCTDNTFRQFGSDFEGSCDLVFVQPGVYIITASYSGDSNYAPSTTTLSVTVKFRVDITITAHTPNPSSVDQAVLVQYSLIPERPNLFQLIEPTGTVVVSDGVNSCQATIAAGQCNLILATAGVRTITASYSGDSNYRGDSTSANHTVIGYPSTTSITADTPDPSDQGQAISVSYSVVANDPSKGTLSGNVTVSDGIDSCTGTVAAGSCALTFSTVGARTLTATYAGNTRFVGSTSAGEPHTVNVPDTTPPTITVSGTKADGAPYTLGAWTNQNVLVHFTCNDSASGVAVCPGDQVISLDGTFTASGTATDNAGNSAGVSFGPMQIDKAKPVITASRTPVANDAGWNNSDVTVSFTCADNPNSSGLATNTVAGATVSTEGANQAVTNSGACVDNAGNAAAPVTVSAINLDKSSPTISAAATTPPNANGWYNSDVTVRFTCADNLAGVTSCPSNETLSNEGNAVNSTAPTISDLAGNQRVASNVVTVQIDKTVPVVTVTGVSNGAGYTLGSVPTAGCSTTDALSGVATQATLSVSGGNANGTGSFTATCSGATDNAGNSGSANVTYSVAYNWTGFLQPVDNLPTVNTVNAGAGIPVKFSLGGNFGSNIFASGYPVSQNVSCGSDGSGSSSPIEETVTAGSSGLQYDPITQVYTYIWKSDKAWAGTCRQLMVKLSDGSDHLALFQFKGKARSADVEAEETAPRVTVFMPLINR